MSFVVNHTVNQSCRSVKPSPVTTSSLLPVSALGPGLLNTSLLETAELPDAIWSDGIVLYFASAAFLTGMVDRVCTPGAALQFEINTHRLC